MAWARLDDRFPNHPKVLALNNAEFRLHVSAICYCCDQLTDGHVASCVPKSLPSAPRAGRLLDAIRNLERVGLWDRTDDGWIVHDFLDWNPSAEQVKAKKAARAEAGRRGGLAKGKAKPKQLLSKSQGNASGLLHTLSKQTGTPSPSPSLFASEEARSGSRPRRKPAKRSTQFPDVWSPNDSHRQRAREIGLDVDAEAVRFEAHHRSKGTESACWNSSFTTWLLNSRKYRDEREAEKRGPDREVLDL